MALIECPECGKEVSELANSCPNCAFPFKEYRKGLSCPECSQKISDQAEICPSCGFPIKPKRIVPKAPKVIPPSPGLWGAMTGNIKSKIVCPYCNALGCVGLKKVERKSGLHGGKATVGLFTGGLSLLATGLSRKMPSLEYKCYSCGAKWIG